MFHKSILTILVAMALTITATAQDALIGNLVWPANKAGIYDIDLQTGDMTPRILDPEMLTLQPGGAYGQAAVRRDNLYYVTNYFTLDSKINVYHAVYDLNTNERVWIKRNGLLASAPMDMTYCEADGKTYGCFHCPEGLGEAYVFGTLNLETFEVTRIKLIYQRWLALAAAPDGTLYAINNGGVLMKVNKTNGNTQVVAQTEAPVYFESSACISDDGEAMYLNVTAMDGSAFIMTIDLKTGETLDTRTFPNEEEFLGLATLEPANEQAPAPATRFEVPVCPTNKATVSWDMPAGDAPLTAVITMDGNEVYRGRHSAGATVEKQIDAKLTGYHTFTLRLQDTEDEELVSTAVSVRRWIGPDTPCAPENVTFTRAGKTNTVTWDAVTKGVNEGYVDLSRLTYTIRRNPGNELVDGGLTIPAGSDKGTWSEEMEEPSSLITMYYTVEAVVGGSGDRSERGESNHISFSSIYPPYSQTFDDESSIEAFTIIDGNNDGESWHWYTNKSMRIFGSDYKALNDWLITPAVHLEAGKYYEFSLTLHGFKRAYTEYFEIACGRGNSASAMNVTLLPNTQLSADAPSKFTVGYLVPETGDYFFGLHATSPAGTQYIYADNFYISEGREPLAPSPVSDLTLTRAPKGHIAVDVAFTLPTTNVGGTPLTEITKYTVIRDGYELLREETDVEPGQRIEFTDEPGMTNFRRYSVYVYNNEGVSMPAEAMEYVGPYAPDQPTDFIVERTANDGEVRMTWKTPTVDKNGDELDPDLITFTVAAIVDGAPAYIREKFKGNEIVYQAQPAGKPQAFVNFALYAQTEGGSSSKLESTPCPVGAPYKTPFVESFAGGYLQTIWFPEDVFGITVWDMANDETLEDITSRDGDNGFIYAISAAKGNTSTLNSGLITITEESPVLEINYWSQGLNDIARTIVKIKADGKFHQVATVDHKASADGWQSKSVPLSEFMGKDIQIQLLAQFGVERIVAYDNIRIMSDVTDNLSIAEYNIPANVQAGKTFTVTATIQNNGKTDVAGAEYSTVLLRDGKEVNRKRGFGTLRVGKSANVTFNETLSIFDEGKHTYQLLIDYDDDDKTDDNATGQVDVTCSIPDYPTPDGLIITTYGDYLKLTWAEPEEPEFLPTTTEDFESYDNGEMKSLGEWTLVDYDQAVSGTIGGLPIPGIVSGSTFLSYVIVDNTTDDKLKNVTAHSGNKVLLSMFAKYEQNDEWLISPTLSGHAQTISLWARSGSASYPESFQVMGTSEYSVNPDDYEEIGFENRIPNKWNEYTFDLPEGTVHFAIRCISSDAYYFTIDDITYTNDLHSTYDLLGYNIYRNGKKVNDEPIEALELDDTDTDATYHVTAVYHKGESRPVAFDTVIDHISSVAGSDKHEIYDLSGRRINRANKGVNIINGKKIIK